MPMVFLDPGVDTLISLRGRGQRNQKEPYARTLSGRILDFGDDQLEFSFLS
jgi:hypothetical protein